MFTEKEWNDILQKHFANAEEAMKDFYELTKEEFLNSYLYLTDEDYHATQKYLSVKFAGRFYPGCIECEKCSLKREC